MSAQMVFKRYEMKYLLSGEQKERVLYAMAPYMQLDSYGRSIIRNIYYDTDTYRLIRTSLEKPIYKEKLRVRSYGAAKPEDKVFVELKKKYDSVVYTFAYYGGNGLFFEVLQDFGAESIFVL